MNIAEDRIRRVLRYEACTATFYWRRRTQDDFNVEVSELQCAAWNRRFAGRQAINKVSKLGYFCGKVLRKTTLAHRVVWLFETGSWPIHGIDHIDGNTLNNQIENLRDVPHHENMRNKGLQINNTSGISGVYWSRNRCKWYAQIRNSGKLKHLGYFATMEDAAEARRKAEKKLGFHANHGSIRNG